MIPDTFKYFLLAIGLLTLIPLGYIYYFLIIELRKKFGYLKFSTILIGYLILWVVLTQLLSEGHINIVTYIISPILLNLLGVYYLRHEFVSQMKRLFKIKDKSSLHANHKSNIDNGY